MENTTQQTQDPTTITVVDLDTLRNIIDLATTRGAFRAGEMAEIGAVYNKLTQFLEAVIAQAKAQEEAGKSADSENTQGE